MCVLNRPRSKMELMVREVFYKVISVLNRPERSFCLPSGIAVSPTKPPLAWAKSGSCGYLFLKIELIPNGELEHAVVPVTPP